MTQGLESDGVFLPPPPPPPASLRLWLTDIDMQTGLLPQVFSHTQPESGALEGRDVDDGCSPKTSWHRGGGDGRKRKELSAGTSEEDSGTFDHKRHRQVHTQSSASSSYCSVATSGTDVLSCDTIAERPSSVLLSAALKQPVFKEQGRATGVLRLAEVVDTSCWSTDGGHDEISGGNTSTFTSSEEEDSQLHQPLGSFLNVKHKGPASIGPNGRARTHMWSDTGGLLSLQLDTFIEKEKDKIESSDTAGSGAQSLSKSEWSLSGSLHGVESSGSQERPFVDRSTGSGADIGGSCSMEDGSSFLARRCTQARSQGRSRLEIVESDPVNSMLLSYLSKQQLSTLKFCRTEESVMSGMEGRGKEERKRTLAVQKLCPVSIGLQGPIYGLPGVQLSSTENMRMQDEDGIRSSDTHQTFVLSSGRPSSTEGIRSSDTHQTFVLSSGRPSSTEGIRSSDTHQTFVLSSGRPSRTEGIRSSDTHQTFVLSSGRPSSTEEARPGKPMSTIDCDFDAYFAKLML